MHAEQRNFVLKNFREREYYRFLFHKYLISSCMQTDFTSNKQSLYQIDTLRFQVFTA